MSETPDSKPHKQHEFSKRALAALHLSTAQVCARYSISRTTVWRWIKAGRLPEPVQIGPGIRRFSIAALDQADAAWAARTEGTEA
ncbi:MAG: helix-turn-helix transcriptional regulator [Roseovarius sp.]|uniref:helix-turn-helix transcriptional regulator n=1 Tax=Roseovarius sp. TaxID=1486281 RepID=UPI00405A2F9B